MPETPNPKLREAPPPNVKSVARSSYAYAELDIKTNFSFLCGASHADELVYRAAELGYRAIGITDVNTLSGVVRAHEAAKEVGLKLLVGSRLTFSDAPDLLVWASNRGGYARLCRLLTLGKRRTEKGECDLKLEDFLNDNEGIIAAVGGNDEVGKARRHEGTKARREGRSREPGARSQKPEGENFKLEIANRKSQIEEQVAGISPPSSPFVPSCLRASVPSPISLLRSSLGSRLSLIATCSYGSDDASHLRRLDELSRRYHIPLLATNAVHYHDPSRRMLQDVLTCVRHGCTIHEAGFRLFPNGERYLKSPRQMHRLFADYPQALRRGLEIAEQCDFQLDSLRYEYPDELVPAGKTPIEHLSDLAWSGAAEHYPAGIPQKVRDLLDHELKLIAQLKFEAYFLTVHDLVRYARSRGILCQGRGSAANSAVCFCIGVTSVNPAEVDLLFERFISAARNEPPDIDVDFEHERREEVIQYIYEKYGRERAGMTAEVITYRGRSAVRDVGKAMGLTLDMVDTMASKLDWWHRGVLSEPQLRECGLDPADLTIRRVITLATALLGFPRHLSQHVGGMVMTRGPLCELVPIENASMPDRTVIEWDKNDIDSLGILKVDVLALGMLTCISKAFKLIESGEQGTEARRHEGTKGRMGDVIGGDEEETDNQGEVVIQGEIGVKEQETKNCGESHDSNSSGFDCLATRNATGQEHVRDNQIHAQNRAVWVDQSNASGSRIDSLQHCRGICSSEQGGLHQISEDCTGVAGRVVDPVRVIDRTGVARSDQTNYESDGRDRSCSPRPHPKPATGPTPEKARRHGDTKTRSKENLSPRSNPPSSPPCLRASVPSCLSPRLSLSSLRPIDPEVYEMISNADTIGVFQVESRAQMSMLPRLRPNCFYDLVIEVAIVRPGPIQGNMVHPYLRRRCGEEVVTFPSEELRQVLSKTLGVPLFQEQAMRIAMVAAGFTADEADKLRRAMAAWRRTSALEAFHQKIVNGMLANGYEREFAEQCFNQIKGFGEYGFPESHAASFALLVYVSAWLKRYHPAAFAAALINSQPMGFYMPAQIVRDAKEHGVKVLAVDVNWSEWDCTLERHEGTEARRHEGKTGAGEGTGGADGGREGSTALGSHSSEWGIGGPALRLGLRQIKGFREAHAGQIVEARVKLKRFNSVEQFHRTTHLPVAALRILAEADAFGSLGLSRRQALWEVLELKDGEEGLFGDGLAEKYKEGELGIANCKLQIANLGEEAAVPVSAAPVPPVPILQFAFCNLQSPVPPLPTPPLPIPPPVPPPCLRASVPSCLLPPMPLGQEVMTDYATAGLSLKQHPVALVREELKRRRILCSKDLDHVPNGRWVNVAGLVLIRQRPGTASGIVFETLEDETGIVNLIVKPDIYERYRLAARHAGLLQADGYLQKQGQVVHVIAKRLFDLSELLQGHEFQSRDFH